MTAQTCIPFCYLLVLHEHEPEHYYEDNITELNSILILSLRFSTEIAEGPEGLVAIEAHGRRGCGIFVQDFFNSD